MDPRAILDNSEMGKISSACQESNSRPSIPYICHHTDRATLVLTWALGEHYGILFGYSCLIGTDLSQTSELIFNVKCPFDTKNL
jgi:hypothetical protein